MTHHHHHPAAAAAEQCSLSIRKSAKRWKQSQGVVSTCLLAVLALALATCAWLSLILPSWEPCSSIESRPNNPLAMFPWEPPEPDQQHGMHWWPSFGQAIKNFHDLNLNNIVFGIAGSAQTWPRRKEYVKLWWRPGEMQGFVWLEETVKQDPDEPLPPIMVSENITGFSYTNPSGNPSGIRIARIVQEMFRLSLTDVHWFVMGDDDTVYSPSNLVRVLRKYDPREMYYIGNPSESHSSNTYFSHGMAFGGGGIAISYALAEALTTFLDECLERYPFLFGSDDRLHACITELGVPLTKEVGFHQFDIHGNAFGLLAAHPIAPFISLHHLDEVEPVFPGYSAMDSMRHLTKSMQMEPSSFLQHSICYDRNLKLTISISSGFVVQVYPYVLLPRELEKPEITFKAWNKKVGRGEFDFDTRLPVKSICKKPFLFFWETGYSQGLDVINLYKGRFTVDSTKRWSFCFSYTLKLKDVHRIQVISKPMSDQWFKVPRRQCCRATPFANQEVNISVSSC